MSSILQLDISILDDIFEMTGGWVLDFSDRTMEEFFSDINISIYSPQYMTNGTSKAKIFRCFLKKIDNKTAAKSINYLLEYRATKEKYLQLTQKQIAGLKNLFSRLGEDLILQEINENDVKFQAKPNFNYDSLLTKFQVLLGLPPQERGYAFERFLIELFDSSGLSPKSPFKLKGEQIDGSFQLGEATYLVEAKWEATKTGVDKLHTFHGKLDEKAHWTRGIFISYSGFSEDGLHTFGRGKRLICLSGEDLWYLLEKRLPLPEVINNKARIAAETGKVYAPIRELY